MEQANEWRDKRVAQYFSLDSWLFWTIVKGWNNSIAFSMIAQFNVSFISQGIKLPLGLLCGFLLCVAALLYIAKTYQRFGEQYAISQLTGMSLEICLQYLQSVINFSSLITFCFSFCHHFEFVYKLSSTSPESSSKFASLLPQIVSILRSSKG